MIFLAEAAASSSGVAPTLKPVEKLGGELITNGGFDYDEGWTKETAFTVSNGQAVADGTLDAPDIYQSVADLSGEKVKVSFTLREYEVGTLSVVFHSLQGGTTSGTPAVSANGNYSFVHTVTSTHNDNVGFRGFADFKGKLDNLSVKKIEQEAVDFSVVRSSHLNATRVGHDKFIKRGRENLVGNSVWSGAGTDTKPSGTSWVAPAVQGGVTFAPVSSNPDRITFSVTNASGAEDRCYLVSKDITTAGVYTQSVRINALTGTAPAVNQVITGIADGGTKTAIAYFKDGVKINATDAVVSGSRYAASAHFTAGSYYRFGIGVSADISATATITLSEPQVERGVVPTPYIKTFVGDDSRAAGEVLTNQPRYDYHATTKPRILLESQRKNMVAVSEIYVQGSGGVSTNLNYGLSPDGRRGSLAVQKSGVNANDRIRVMNDSSITLVSGDKYTISAFVKNVSCSGTTTLACRVNGATLFRQGFAWASGSAGADVSVSDSHGGSGTRTNKFAESYGNGWWRIGFTFVSDGTAGNFEIDVDRQNAAHTTSIETWGWQLETCTATGNPNADHATSYIPTYGAASTRLHDQFFINDLPGKGMITDTQGTVFVDFDEWSTIAVQFDLRSGGNVIYALRLYANSLTSFQFIHKNADGGQSVLKQFGGLPSGGRRKAAFAWNRDVAIMSLNGTSFTTSIHPDIAEKLERFNRPNNTTTTVNTRAIMLFPKQLSESELNELTTL